MPLCKLMSNETDYIHFSYLIPVYFQDQLSEIDQLRIAVTKKDEDIRKLEDKVETLQAAVQQLTSRLKFCEIRINCQLQRSLETKDNENKLDEMQISMNDFRNPSETYEHYLNLKLDSGIEQTISQLNTKVESLSNTIDEMGAKQIVNSNVNVFQWSVPFGLLKLSEQKSEEFYTAVLPFCFRLTAEIKENDLDIYLQRCRGKNDKPIGFSSELNLKHFMFVLYVFGAGGRVRKQKSYFKKWYFNIDADCHGQTCGGWRRFLNGPNWNEWLINFKVYIFCEITLNPFDYSSLM